MAISKSQIIENAQRYAASGKIDEAIAEWTHLLSETVQAQDGNIYNTISDLYLRKNDKESAIQTCLKAAQVYKETGFDLKGVAVLKKIFKIDPDRIDIYERLADINLERGLTGSAIEGYQKTAKLYMQRGNFKAAIGVYKKLSGFYPEDPEIFLAIGRLHQKLEQNREAILAYEQAEAIYESKSMTTEARQIVEEIVKLNPNYIKSLAKKEAVVAELDNILSAKDIALPVTAQHEGYNPLTSVSEYNADDLLHGLPETGSDSAPAPFHPPDENGAVPGGSNAVEGVLFSEASSQKESFLNLEEEGAMLSSGQTRIFSEESDMLPSRMSAKNVEPRETPDVTEVIFRAHLAEVDVYLRYGLHQNALEKLTVAKELAPTREEPYLRLRELYLKEGQNEKAAHEVLALIKIYEQQGRYDKKEALLAEMRTLRSEPGTPPAVRENFYPSPYPLKAPPVGTAPPAYNGGSSNAEGGVFVPPPPPPPRPVGGSVPLMREGAPRGGFPAGGSRSQDRLRSEDEYFDLGSAVANELGSLTEAGFVYPTPEKAHALSEQGVYKDKRQEYIETCHHLGIAHKEMGNYEKAVRELEQALPGALGKKFQEILVMLASCYAESGYVAQAIHLLQGGMDDPRCEADIRPFIQYELASYFEQLGDREKSFSLYKEIYRANPHFKDVSGKVKEIPYRRAGSDPGWARERPQEPMSIVHDMPLEGGGRKMEPVKDKRRISYV